MTTKTEITINNILNTINHNKFLESDIVGISFSTFKKYVKVEGFVEVTSHRVSVSPNEIVDILNEYGTLDGWCELSMDEGKYTYDNGQFFYEYKLYEKYYKIIK